MQNYNVAHDLPKQFLITRSSIDPPPGWSVWQLGDRSLLASPELPVTTVVDASAGEGSADTVLVLGWFVLNGTLYPGPFSGTLHTDAPIESRHHDMTGRFVILRSGNAGLRCITDAGALLPLVFRAETDEAASTPAALALTDAVTVSESRRDGFRRTDGTTWYPFGVTPFTGVERVMPSSILELPSGRTHAVPVAHSAAGETKEKLAHIHMLTRDFVGALAAAGKLDCHLTAGWDSRMVLAAGIRTNADIEYLTYRMPAARRSIDCLVSSHIAQALSLNHKEIDVQAPCEHDIDQWIQRTSGCVLDAVMNLCTTVARTDSGRNTLCGLAGEVGRAFYWRADDIGQTGIRPPELLRRLGFIETRLALELAEAWLSQQSGSTVPGIMDQAYIDLRLGGWAGPSMYGHPIAKPTLSPFNNATIFATMMAMPERFRCSGRFSKEFVALGSAQLARIPVNRATGLNRFRYIRQEISALLPKSTKSSLRALVSRQ